MNAVKLRDLHAIRDRITGTNSKSQAARLLEALHQYAISTYEASRHLDLYDPRARLRDLRNAGHLIDTHWQTVQIEAGVTHRVGNYVLRRAAA